MTVSRMKKVWMVLALAALVAQAGCGEDAETDDGSCSNTRSFRTSGEIGGVDAVEVRSADAGTLDRDTPFGSLTDNNITIDMGQVEFAVSGSDEPELRDRVLFFHTNVADPEGSNLKENIGRRFNSGVEDADVLTVVAPADGSTYCDVEEGEICVRFGFDDTGNGELSPGDDGVVHEGIGGTVRVKELASRRIALVWDIEFGPNISRFGDMTDGQMEGCFDAAQGNPVAGATPLEALP